MEQLQIHSRSYIVRWIHVNAGESISWSLQPHKKGLNFGIFKHPGGKGAATNLPTSATLDVPPTPSESEFKGRRNSTAKEKEGVSAVVDKLQGVGLKCVSWKGKCEADQVSMGRFDVVEGEDGMYGLVFDNTFSKTVAKTATFVLMTHPTTAPPKSGAQLRYSNSQAATSSTSVGRSPSLRPRTASLESLQHDIQSIPSIKIPRRGSATSVASAFYTGIMHKKRRKKNQGYARRFFSLDFTSSTLSYYRNSHASALRGSVPLSLAAIGVDEKRKEFSIDSGAEVWHLRLRNKKDFEGWMKVLERATSAPVALPSPAGPRSTRSLEEGQASSFPDPLIERDWARVEQLVGRVSGTRDAVRRLAQDTDPKYNSGSGPQSNGSPAISPVEGNPFFQDAPEKEAQKLPFWKRKPSSGNTSTESRASLLRRSFSAQGAVATQSSVNGPASPALSIPKIRAPSTAGLNEDIHDRCMALLRDLDATMSEFSSLLTESKARRRPAVSKTTSRLSMESSASGEDFFDAAEAPDAGPQMMSIRNSDELASERDDFFSDTESLASTNTEPEPHLEHSSTLPGTLFPSPAKFPVPSSIPPINPRTSIPPPRQPPPSIVSFLRKNAGKDLSTVAMPVTANEPLSLLQRLAEPLENAPLLTLASSASSPTDRLLYITAFAIGTLASNRVKERAVRKPFNPMLGETFELVRKDPEAGAYRFVAEKVTHHPVRMAWQADDLGGRWSVAQTPRPVQKFWGKSVEVNTEGRMRVSLAPVGQGQGQGRVNGDVSRERGAERYSWATPTAYLRNVIAGEKYVEPTGSLTVVNELDGAKAVASFKASGMFSGRSEEVTVQVYGREGEQMGVGLVGTWTKELRRTDTDEVIWRAAEVVKDAGKNWGFSVFAAGLNELTPVEEGKLPPTDSRLRPDQKSLEKGELDAAEGLKARLEERQRGRRKVMEAHGRAHDPVWFEKVDGDGEEEAWRLKSGKDGYWDRREKADWKGLVDVFEM
ncbi:putative oxysterol-binding protein 1 [Elsinoe fawcettii]|nr:putative oxysterol-binding protein 1 [Elsinoe fawcettii]